MIRLSDRADGGQVWLDDANNIVTIRPMYKTAVPALPAPPKSKKNLSKTQRLADKLVSLNDTIPHMESEIGRLNYLLQEERAARLIEFRMHLHELKTLYTNIFYAHNSAHAGLFEQGLKFLTKARTYLEYALCKANDHPLNGVKNVKSEAYQLKYMPSGSTVEKSAPLLLDAP